MNKKATLFIMLLAFAFSVAQAAKVTQEQVKFAAKGWVARGGMLGARLGRAVDSVAVHTTTNGSKFYAVRMSGGGTLFMSSDTDYNPVIAFTSSNYDFSTIDRKSPLWAILNRDVSRLKSATEASKVASAANTEQALKMAALAASGSKLWRELIAEGSVAGDDQGLKFEDPLSSSDPGDLRVGPLVKSKWSQSVANDKACWNYYTPNGKDPDKFVAGDKNNMVCGCVATAMAQIMRYHEYPVEPLEQLQRGCFWNTDEMRLTTQGGVYEWAKMPLVVNGKDDLTEENYQAIGKLASDAGISVYMQYNSDGDGESGAFAFDISGAMMNYWKYGSAVYLNLSSGNIDGSDLVNVSRRALYANFDAGLPVFMGIPGHQIVADGYGWNNEFEYVHLNMGWAGKEDFWYNLPNIPDFNAVDDLVYNVVPKGSLAGAVISGRTVNDEGEPVAGAIVELYQADNLVTQLVTSASGVWGAMVNAGTYRVSAYFSDGVQTLLGDIESVSAAKPTAAEITWNSLRKVDTVRTVSNIGNSWGNDITLVNPSVRVGGELFGSLEQGIAAAKQLSVPLVEIVAPTELRRDVDIDFDCIIVSAETVPADTLLVRRDDAVMTVVAGGSLTLSNLVFDASSVTPVEVASGGALTISGEVEFGTDYNVASVSIAESDALTVVGALKNRFLLDCAEALEIGQSFGTLIGLSVEDAKLTAAKIGNFNDDSGEINGSIEGDASPFVLKWDEIPVAFEDCTGYYVDSDFVTNTSARIDRLMIKFENDVAKGKIPAGSEIVVKKSGSFSRELAVGTDIRIRGENGAVLDAFRPASFVVTNATLVVEGLGFKGYKGNSLFLVNGGELVMSNGVSIAGMVGTNYYSGAVAVLSGTATLGPDITISDCGFESLAGGSGAAVYVNKDATLNFFGGTITGCRAIGDGGGAIYVNRKATLNLKGEMDITENYVYSQGEYRKSNIFVFGISSTVNVTGPVSGKLGIAYGSTAGSYNGEDGPFAKVQPNLSNKDLAGIGRNAGAFVNDINPTLNATFSSTQENLVWTGDAIESGSVPGNLTEFAYARVVEAGGACTYYWSLADAVSAVDEDGSSVEMLQSDNFDEELVVGNKEVRLVSALESGLASLTGGTFRVTGSLVLTNVLVAGESLFNVDGGLLLLDGPMVSEVGCVGASKTDANIFGMVRADLSYESLTNSAANFRNVAIDAYGVAVTNASAGTALVWSRSIEPDGTYVGEDGTTWLCVGEIPVYAITVNPEAIAFKSIVRDDATGTWNLTLTNLVRGCWYSLYSTNSLSGGFAVGEGIAEPVTNFQAEADGEFIFQQEAAGGSMFWKAIGEPGVIVK